MGTKKRALLGAIILLNTGTSRVSAQPTRLTFTQTQCSGAGVNLLRSSYTESGFTFTTAGLIYGLAAWCDANPAATKSFSIFNNTPRFATVLTQANGNPFAIQSMAFAPIYSSNNFDMPVSITGHLVGGGSVQASLVVPAGAPGTPQLQTFTFASGWTNLSSVEWTPGQATAQWDFVQFDDVVVTASTTVPEPSSLPLSLFGLLVIGGISRRIRRRA